MDLATGAGAVQSTLWNHVSLACLAPPSRGVSAAPICSAAFSVASSCSRRMVSPPKPACIPKLRTAIPAPAQEVNSSIVRQAILSVPALFANICLLPMAPALATDGLPSFLPFELLTFADLDPAIAMLLLRILGPVFSSLNFLFIIRIVMSWYPQLPVNKFPYIIAFAPTEPVLEPTRKIVPPIGGVDISPVIWVAIISFLNEILLGQQGLLVLLSQQQG